MSVFIVFLEDRHINVHVEAYTGQGAAMKRAKDIVSDYNPARSVEQFDLPKGHLFFKRLNEEGDCVYVQEIPVNVSRSY